MSDKLHAVDACVVRVRYRSGHAHIVPRRVTRGHAVHFLDKGFQLIDGQSSDAKQQITGDDVRISADQRKDAEGVRRHTRLDLEGVDEDAKCEFLRNMRWEGCPLLDCEVSSLAAKFVGERFSYLLA